MAYQSEIEKLQRRYEEKPEQWFAAYADAYRKAGELDVALEIVRSGIEERPNYVSGYIVLGRCLVDQGKDSEAQEAFEQVLALDAENIIALSNLGEVAERAGDVTGARRWLERLLEVDPMNDKAKQSLQRLALAEPPATEAVQETPATDASTIAETTPVEAALDEQPSDQVGATPEEQPAAMSHAEDARAFSEPPVIESAPDIETKPPATGGSPEAVHADSFEPSDRFGPPLTEPGPDLLSAEEEPMSAALDEEDVSSVFGASSSQSSAHDDARDLRQFLIERHSDPFETPSEAREAQQDAAALWASLGEDPELESVPDAESTARDEAGAIDADLGGETPEIASFAEPDQPEEDLGASDTLEPVFEPPVAPSAGGTTQMSVTDLNALVERERQEARERDRGDASDRTSALESLADEGNRADEELIGGPPPEYQLESSGPGRASDNVPLFSDSDLLEAGSFNQDIAGGERPIRPAGAPADEPMPVMERELAPDLGADSDQPREPEKPLSTAASLQGAEDADDVVTETMAEVYAAQGLYTEAKEVYRRLLERRPGDDDVEARLAALETRERQEARIDFGVTAGAPAKPKAREYAASRTGGVSARTYLAELLGERPRPVSPVSVESTPEPPAATTVLDETFASDRPDSQGQPTRPAADEMSLASVFGDSTPDMGEFRPSSREVSPPPPPPPPAASSSEDLDLSFDSFFSSGSQDQGAAPAEEDGERDDDDEDFKAWLKSLKS